MDKLSWVVYILSTDMRNPGDTHADSPTHSGDTGASKPCCDADADCATIAGDERALHESYDADGATGGRGEGRGDDGGGLHDRNFSTAGKVAALTALQNFQAAVGCLEIAADALASSARGITSELKRTYDAASRASQPHQESSQGNLRGTEDALPVPLRSTSASAYGSNEDESATEATFQPGDTVELLQDAKIGCDSFTRGAKGVIKPACARPNVPKGSVVVRFEGSSDLWPFHPSWLRKVEPPDAVGGPKVGRSECYPETISIEAGEYRLWVSVDVSEYPIGEDCDFYRYVIHRTEKRRKNDPNLFGAYVTTFENVDVATDSGFSSVLEAQIAGLRRLHQVICHGEAVVEPNRSPGAPKVGEAISQPLIGEIISHGRYLDRIKRHCSEMDVTLLGELHLVLRGIKHASWNPNGLDKECIKLLVANLWAAVDEYSHWAQRPEAPFSAPPVKRLVLKAISEALGWEQDKPGISTEPAFLEHACQSIRDRVEFANRLEQKCADLQHKLDEITWAQGRHDHLGAPKVGTLCEEPVARLNRHIQELNPTLVDCVATFAAVMASRLHHGIPEARIYDQFNKALEVFAGFEELHPEARFDGQPLEPPPPWYPSEEKEQIAKLTAERDNLRSEVNRLADVVRDLRERLSTLGDAMGWNFERCDMAGIRTLASSYKEERERFSWAQNRVSELEEEIGSIHYNYKRVSKHDELLVGVAQSALSKLDPEGAAHLPGNALYASLESVVDYAARQIATLLEEKKAWATEAAESFGKHLAEAVAKVRPVVMATASEPIEVGRVVAAAEPKPDALALLLKGISECALPWRAPARYLYRAAISGLDPQEKDAVDGFLLKYIPHVRSSVIEGFFSLLKDIERGDKKAPFNAMLFMHDKEDDEPWVTIWRGPVEMSDPEMTEEEAK